MSIASVLETLRREYTPALRVEIRALEVAVETEDWLAARRIAHRVAGTAGSYGFKAESAAARTIEDALESNEHAKLGPALEMLRKTVPDNA